MSSLQEAHSSLEQIFVRPIDDVGINKFTNPQLVRNHRVPAGEHLDICTHLSQTPTSPEDRIESGPDLTMTAPEAPSVHLRPIKVAYDPLLTRDHANLTNSSDQLAEILKRPHENSILISPSSPSIGVPWFSSFGFTRQNKHWHEAESACRRLLPAIHRLALHSGAKVPAGFRSGSSDELREKKETMFVDTAVACGIYMHPNASEKRMALIAQALLVLWTHDDTVEDSPDHLGMTATDFIMSGFDPSSSSSSALSKSHPLFASIFSDLFAESPSLGLELSRSMLSFVRNTCTQQAASEQQWRGSTSSSFGSLRSYLDFRSVDFGRAFNFAAIKFARDIRLSDAEAAPLARLADIADDHHMLVNDLYSFEKEREEVEERGDKPLLNAVAIVRDLLGLESYDDAKRTVRDLVLQWEDRARGELVKMNGFMEEGLLNERQWDYMEGIFQSMSGNHFFSCTAPRYHRTAL